MQQYTQTIKTQRTKPRQQEGAALPLQRKARQDKRHAWTRTDKRAMPE